MAGMAVPERRLSA